MSTPQRKRWVCPECGKGALAPSRLRSNDVRRFCLPCSVASGLLVERRSPALDRQRAATSAARSEQAKADRAAAAAARQARATVEGFDLAPEAKRMWKALAEWHGGASMPTILWRRAKIRIGHTTGHCRYGSRRIVVTLGSDLADAQETVLHELVHAVVLQEGHSMRFWTTLRSAARKLWPEVDFGFNEGPNLRGWDADQQITAGLRRALELEA